MQHNNITRDKLDELNTQLRIMILQNVREEEEYDENFLQELNRITQKILDLKKNMKKDRIKINRLNHNFSSMYAT